jgi:alkanesulfonate monooxygenase SsuD/methylene tetrahydromethanopterin reductase-like flavin-dependent oxidoreductase (luciferase family)
MPKPQFGFCLPIFANPGAALFRTPNYPQLDAEATMELGQYAEQLGFDSLWVADHLMLGKDEAILEGWTVLSALGGSTTRARIGMIHQAHYFRAPALAAKMTATLDQITGGRLIVFYDYGQQAREHHAYHLPYPEDVDTRVTQTVEGIRLIKEMWAANEPLSVDGDTYAIDGAVCNPGPVQKPHPPIWFGETHPGLLAACAEFGQGWNTTPVSPDELRLRLGLLKDACDLAGRPYGSIEKSVELQVLIAPEAGARDLLGRILDAAGSSDSSDAQLRAYANGTAELPPVSLSDTTLIGTPDEIREQIQSYLDTGVDHFLLWFLDAPDRGGIDLFAREVLPHVHKQS